MVAVCQLTGCDQPIPETRLKHRARYCTDRCRITAARSDYIVRKADDEVGVSIDDRIARERERLANRDAARQLAELQRSAAKRAEYIDVLDETLCSFEPSPFIVPKFKQGKAKVAWGIDLSDWQIGQYTPIQSTGGIYEQTTEIAHKQLDRIWEAVQSIFDVEIASGMKKLEDLWLCFIGDLVDGDCLRPSQAASIDRIVTKQVIETADLAALFIRRCLTLPGIKHIIIDMVGGNHDRTSTKAGNAGLGELDFCDTYAWLIGHWLKKMFENEPRIEIKVWDTFFGFREFGGMRHAFEHGASFRGTSGAYGGVPWYPISNAAQQYIKMLGGVDMVHMGHFHQPAILPLGQNGWTVMNGALPVSSQFIQSSFKGVRRPQQWLIEYNLKHGWVNNWHALYADVGQLAAPGSVWDAA